MELLAIWHEDDHAPQAHAPEGYVNPAAMDAWAADSIETREAMKAGHFE